MYSNHSFEPSIAGFEAFAAWLKPAHLIFLFLFVFRFTRLVVHIFSNLVLYKATPIPAQPTLTPKDCTIILPTVEPGNDYFKLCVNSVLANGPRAIIIVTVGTANRRRAEEVVATFRKAYPDIRIQVKTTKAANKRRQVCAAVHEVKTKITVLVDDHVSCHQQNSFAPFWHHSRTMLSDLWACTTVLVASTTDSAGPRSGT
jgi:hypothetical protein